MGLLLAAVLAVPVGLKVYGAYWRHSLSPDVIRSES